jgi:hypothetical protein
VTVNIMMTVFMGVKQGSLIITSGSEDHAASICRFEDFFKC